MIKKLLPARILSNAQQCQAHNVSCNYFCFQDVRTVGIGTEGCYDDGTRGSFSFALSREEAHPLPWSIPWAWEEETRTTAEE